MYVICCTNKENLIHSSYKNKKILGIHNLERLLNCKKNYLFPFGYKNGLTGKMINELVWQKYENVKQQIEIEMPK